MFGPFGPAVPLAGNTVPRSVFRRLVEAAEPAGPVISTVDLKIHLRVSHSSEDAYIASLERSAVLMVQNYIGKKLLSRNITMWMDFVPGMRGGEYLPSAGTLQLPVGAIQGSSFRWFELMLRPVASVVSVNFVDASGVNQVFATSNYIVDNSDPDQPARIILQLGSVWPADLRTAKNVNVVYSVGYGAAATDVPYDLLHAVKLVAAALWSNRGDNLDAGLDVLQLPAIRAILDPHRLRQLGGI